MGRLAQDPELKTTATGKSVVNVSVAVQKRYNKQDADFIDIVAWNKTAEFLRNYLSKGTQIIVRGRLETQLWESEGRRNKKVFVTVEEVHPVGNPKKRELGDFDDSFDEPFEEPFEKDFQKAPKKPEKETYDDLPF